MNRNLLIAAIASLSLLAITANPVSAQSQSNNSTPRYTVNGTAVAPEMGMLLQHYGFKPGGYYIDTNGNYGESGSAPTGNLDGGPVRGWSGVEPKSIAGNPYAQAYINGVTGARIFWVYSPSIFSDVKGGGSGYYHICPGNVYYASSEGSVSMSDRPSSGRSVRSSVGVASTSARAGKWAIESSLNGPVLVGYGPNGGSQRVALITLLQGRWKVGQTKYAVEAGKASC